MSPQKPEQQARAQIDAQIVASCWIIQDYKALNFGAGRGIALREVPLKTGPCDYLLLVDRVPVVDRRSKENRAVRWSRTAGDEDLTYADRGPTGPRSASPTFAPCKRERWFPCHTDLDRSVVVKSQIRTVPSADQLDRSVPRQLSRCAKARDDALATVPRPRTRPTTIRRRRTRSVGAADTLFPGRTLVPKVLSHCGPTGPQCASPANASRNRERWFRGKDDSHAEDTVHLVREVFGRGNDFCKKFTSNTHNPHSNDWCSFR